MMKRFKRSKKTGVFLFFLLMGGGISLVSGQEGYPVPDKTRNMLFYFQRSHNKNTVIYEWNSLPNGNINKDKPVNYYWIRYEEGGVRKELSFLQREAFGLKYKLMDNSKDNFILRFNSFDKRNIYMLKVAGRNYYKVYTNINGELAELNKMYIQSENNSLGFPLKVKFVDISGVNVKSGKNVSERYIPQ